MCGITIFLSKLADNIIPEIIRSLNQIQNRGYDSAGLAAYNNTWLIHKFASTNSRDGMETLYETTKELSSSLAIAHTRWATHGGKTDINAHPHMSVNGQIIVVHNGIITNYKNIIDNILIPNNIFNNSETDSEVVANLIEFYLRVNPIKKSIKLALAQLEGTWALGIIYTEDPNNIYVTRHGSPLLLGEDDTRVICCSETSAFIGQVSKYIIIENHDLIILNKDGYTSENIYTPRILQEQLIEDSPEPYPHWTLKEIHEQSSSIMSAINNGGRIENNEIILGGLENLESIIESKNIDHILALGCGTSYHACMFAKYYFNKDSLDFVTVQACDASEFSAIDIPKNGNTLCILCSQSGETRDLINCIKICRKHNCILLGIVNVVDSMIAQSVDCGVYLNAGYERAVASTKSFTSTLTVLSLIGMWFQEKHKNISKIKSLRNIPNNIEVILNDAVFKASCDNLVTLINSKQIQSMFILGRGKMFSIAREGALKIKEISYIHAEGYASSSLKHGPFALLDDKSLTLLLMDEENITNIESTYYEINSRDTNCYILTDTDTKISENVIRIPRENYYQEILFVVALQYIAYQLSISRNINPDRPRNLAKVVTVE